LELSIVIVNYNVKHFLEQCLISVEKATKKIDAEVFVVDNNSVDGSVKLIKEKFPNVSLIENKENTGFSKANNQAINISKGKYVLLLNPDTVVEEDTFLKCINFMNQNENTGALGVKMIDGKGNFLPESKRGLPTPAVAFYKIFGLSRLFPKSKKMGKYHLGFLSKEKNNKIDVLSGAFMFLRKEVLDKVGLLDEEFFMYGEDIDLSYRVTLAGYDNYYFSETSIIHYKGESTKKGSINYVFVFYNAMIIFAKKHFSEKNAKTFSILINWAIYFRAFIALIQRFFSRWSISIFDFFIQALFIFIFSNFYQDFTNVNFPENTLYLMIAFYSLTLTIVSRSFGTHHPPFKFNTILKSTAIGGIILLASYALLPKSFQFSRLVIVVSSLLFIVSSVSIRLLYQWLKIGLFKSFQRSKGRIAIIGSSDEIARIKVLIEKLRPNNKIYKVSTFEQENTKYFDINIVQLDEFIRVKKIEEVIFCAKDISSHEIIKAMSTISIKRNIEFKISPEKSQFIIGSNTIHTEMDMYTTKMNNINSPNNIRKKRTFDLYISIPIVLFSPLILILSSKRWVVLKNIFPVILGTKTWIGYAKNQSNVKLPIIKKNVLNINVNNLNENQEYLDKMNIIYAKDYSVSTDLTMLIKKVFSK
jgi:O-antigen biosynthesis protein